MAAKPEPTPVEKALRLLARRSRTALELDRALARAKVPAEERKAALARVRELGYMDDRALANSRARTLIGRGEAPRMAARRLAMQGVSREDARDATAEAADGASEDELVRRALERKLRGRKPPAADPAGDNKERQRLFRFLLGKGHRAAAISKALDFSWEGEEGDESDGSENKE